MRSDNLPNATAVQINMWETNERFLLGISAHDPVERNITESNQHYFPNWSFPFFDYIFSAINTNKQNVGGVLNRYGSYPEGNNSVDINLWMAVFEEYDEYYELVESLENDDWLFPTEYINQDLDCGEYDWNIPFMLGEIAVPENYIYNNEFFNVTDDHCQNSTYLHKLDTFGMYGVITTDGHHGHNPEVHPVQQFWFRDKNIFNEEQKAYYLFFIQDASDRFDDWAASPVYGQYKVGFRIKQELSEVNQPYTPLTMDIRIETSSDVVTDKFPDQSADCDNGISHSLELNGRTILTVNEAGGEDSDLGIQFTEITKLQDGTIQGYVQISMVIGDVETNAFGMCILNLLITESTLKNISDVKDTGF
jgi:hypothetical protein